jgi:hypothetical protein
MGCGIYFPRDFEPFEYEQGAEEIEDEEEDEELQGMRRLRYLFYARSCLVLIAIF